MHSMFNKTDRLVYMETFLDGKNSFSKGYSRENNPYKQGSVSFLGWDEGWENGQDSE